MPKHTIRRLRGEYEEPSRPGERAAEGRPDGHDEGFLPYRQLAIRVLARALLDATRVGGSASDRQGARLFLAGSPMLFHWCRVAALDPHLVVERASRLGG